MPCIVETKELSKYYGKICAINDVNIRIHQGEIYGIVGKNGAGKTSLLKLIIGLSRPSAGQVLLFGDDNKDSSKRTRIGVLIEKPEFFPYLTAFQNLEYFRIQRGIVEKESVALVLDLMDLTKDKDKKLKYFSLGMKQRLGLALTLLASPDLLVLDEPIINIDPEGVVQVRDLLKRLNSERNVSIILSSHNLSELNHLATRFAILDQGKIIEELTHEELDLRSRAYLDIQVDQPSLAVAILEREFGMRAYQITHQKQIIIYDGMDKAAEINALLLAKGLKVYELTRASRSLEEYFINRILGEC